MRSRKNASRTSNSSLVFLKPQKLALRHVRRLTFFERLGTNEMAVRKFFGVAAN